MNGQTPTMTSPTVLILLAVLGSALMWSDVDAQVELCWQSISSQGTERGSIWSPNYPGNYRFNEECSWHVNTPNGTFIRFTFQWPFNLESNSDFLKVFDTRTGRQEIKSWTGTRVPPAFIAETNDVDVVFDTDRAWDFSGFKLYWEKWKLPDHVKPFTQDTGNISAPTVDRLYQNNHDYEWIINATEDKVIFLTFHSPFDIEDSNDGNCSYDYVEVYDTDPSGSPLSRGRFCGVKVPPLIVATTNRVVVRFHSDDDKTGRGFFLTWESYNGQVFQSEQGNVSSPNYPHPYPHASDYRWEICVHPGDIIRLNFQSPFDIEGNENGTCGSDFLELYDFTTEGNMMLRDRLCGNILPPEYVSRTSHMLLVFHSDDLKTYSGFEAVWESVPNPRIRCSGSYTSPNGSLSSPGFPESYPNNLDCRWEIIVPTGQRIKLEFGSIFSLESGVNGECHDTVQVFDVLSNGTMESEGKWCGEMMAANVLYSTSSQMVVVFKSDKSKSGLGFSATWEAASGCGYTSKSATGDLASPNYPGNYNENQVCRWEITPPAGSDVTLKFAALFDVEISNGCAWDYLQIRVDNTTLGRWCGNETPPKVKVTGGQRLEVIFNSDKSNVGKGFYVSWTDKRSQPEVET